jgi:hypothetical protein
MLSLQSENKEQLEAANNRISDMQTKLGKYETVVVTLKD